MLFSVVHRTSYRYASAVSLSASYGASAAARPAVIRPAVRTNWRSVRCRPRSKRIAIISAMAWPPSTSRSRTGIWWLRRQRGRSSTAASRLPLVGTTLGAGRRRSVGRARSRCAECRGIPVPIAVGRNHRDRRGLRARVVSAGRSILEAAFDLNRRIYGEFTFDPEATTITTAPAEVLALKRGVCQDFAHLAIACCRAMGVPARYISGYLETQPPRGSTETGRGRRVPCLACRLWRRGQLDRSRSYQQSARRARSYRDRHRPRLSRCQPPCAESSSRRRARYGCRRGRRAAASLISKISSARFVMIWICPACSAPRLSSTERPPGRLSLDRSPLSSRRCAAAGAEWSRSRSSRGACADEARAVAYDRFGETSTKSSTRSSGSPMKSPGA